MYILYLGLRISDIRFIMIIRVCSRGLVSFDRFELRIEYSIYVYLLNMFSQGLSISYKAQYFIIMRYDLIIKT